MEVDAHGVGGEAGAVRDLRARHAFHEPQQERLAVGLGKVEHGEQDLPYLAATREVRRFEVGRQLEGFAAGTVVIHRAVAGDGGQPGAERLRVPQLREPIERGHEDVLQEVGHLLGRNPGQQDPVRHGRVPLVEPFEGRAVPGGGGDHPRVDIALLPRLSSIPGLSQARPLHCYRRAGSGSVNRIPRDLVTAFRANAWR